MDLSDPVHRLGTQKNGQGAMNDLWKITTMDGFTSRPAWWHPHICELISQHFVAWPWNRNETRIRVVYGYSQSNYINPMINPLVGSILGDDHSTQPALTSNFGHRTPNFCTCSRLCGRRRCCPASCFGRCGARGETALCHDFASLGGQWNSSSWKPMANSNGTLFLKGSFQGE